MCGCVVPGAQWFGGGGFGAHAGLYWSQTGGRSGGGGGGGGGGGELWLIEVRVIPENPVSILSGDVTGCEWVDSACIRFNK